MPTRARHRAAPSASGGAGAAAAGAARHAAAASAAAAHGAAGHHQQPHTAGNASGASGSGAAHAEAAGVQQAQLGWPLALQGTGPDGWATLPHSALEKIFNHLDLKELAAAGCTCSTWRYEAALDSRWKAFWQQEVNSDVSLWRWAQADGGYRQQLRAKRLVRRGDCTATVFPFSRRDGQVTEVLFFDGGPNDGDKRILTVQAPKLPGQSVRLRGSTLKVWDAASLMAQRPLLVVHDVLKHMQLEDGLLFLWRVADDATIITSVPEGGQGGEEARRWAEHPSIVASVLEPGPCRLRDCPLEATYGRGMTPAEWLDMSGGLIAGSLMVPSQNKLLLRLFDLGTGRCLRASSCDLPQEDQPLQMADQDVTMIVTRSGEAGCLVLATCALFDTRVFLWRLKDEWIAAGQAAAKAAAELAASPGGSSGQQQQLEEDEEETARRLAARTACWDPSAALQVATGALAASPAAAAAAGEDDAAEGSAAAAYRAQYELRHVYSTPDQEPVVDISISSARHCLYIVGMDTITVADLSGTPFMRVSTLSWRGVVPQGEAVGPTDVGAFSWPLPNNSKAAFFLDTTNSLFIADFRRPQMTDWWYMSRTEVGPRHPSYDAHFATALGPDGEPQGQVNYYVQSHTDLRALPKSQYLSTLHGRASGPRDMEPGIVEYTQDGGVLFTTAETACPTVASLLQLEKAGGSYLAGLGPASARFAAGGRRHPYVARGSKGQRGQLAPRALVLIDTASGCRFKAVPIEGAIESLHSAGQYLVLAASELSGFPEGLNGSLVVLDFAGGAGFGCSAEPAGPEQARGGASSGKTGRQRQGRQPKQQQDLEQQDEQGGTHGRSRRRKQQQDEQRRQGKGKSKGGSGGGAARRGSKAAATEDEPGPSPGCSLLGQSPGCGRSAAMTDWDDDEWDDELVQQMDAVVANVQQQRATQAALRPSQPSSPVAAAAGAPLHLQPPQYPPQQQSNGAFPTVNGAHKPPPPPLAGHRGAGPSVAAFSGPPLQQHVQPPLPQQYAPPSQQLHHGAPVGHVSAAAAQLQARMQQATVQPPYGAPREGAAAQLAAVMQEKGRLEGQNKHLQFTLAQKEKELFSLKQRAAQLEKPAGPAGGGPGAHRSSFQVGEMQRQLDSARQQLTFREQEVEDLKRQYADRSERLRQAEAALADLKQQLKQQQQQQQADVQARLTVDPAATGPQHAAPDRRASTGQPSTGTAAAQRGSGAKRRPSSGGPASAGTGSAPPAGTLAVAVTGAGAVGAAAASTAPPLLDPVVFAAAASLRRVGWMDQLMAACSSSIAVLTGAAIGSSTDAASLAAAGAAPPPTVLLLRARSHAAACADPESLRFVAAFVQRLQQVACGMLPPAALLDSLASMVASSLTVLRTATGEASGASLPPQRLQLMAAGLHVVQHLLALDAGCRQAALGALAGSSAVDTAALPGRVMLSSRVTLSGGPAGAPGWLTPATAPAAAQPSWLVACSSSPTLPATAQVLQQHPAAFGALGSSGTFSGSLPTGLLPVLLTAALWLGPTDEAVAAGALGCLLELARALQGPEAWVGLAPLLTSGAMEMFMTPPALRLQAVCLLQLLLEDASLARLFEGSLSQAAAARGEPGPPTATAGNSGGDDSATPGGEAVAAAGGAVGGAAGGPQPMQAEGGDDAVAGPWIGAAAIAERLLDSFVLDDSLAQPTAVGSTAPQAAGSGTSGGGAAAGCGMAVARAVMQLAASLREQRQHGILVYLLLDDACGAPGQMLAQRLVQLAEAALAPPTDEDAALMPWPLPFPNGSGSSSGASSSSSDGTLLHQQAAWQQRLRVAQEALTLLRGLLVDESCGVAAMDDLVTIPATARLTLTTLSRLGRLEPPAAAGAAAAPQPLPLAAWARAIGSSTDQPSIAEATNNSGTAGATATGLPVCAVEDVVYLSKSLRRRVLLRLSNPMVHG